MQSEEYIRYVICKEFGWDFHTYESQPQFFLQEVLLFLIQERNRERNDNAKVGKIPSKGYKRT